MGIPAENLCISSHKNQEQQQQRTLPPSAAANLASLSRIRMLVTSTDGGVGGLGNEGVGMSCGMLRPGSGEATVSDGSNTGRGSSPPDAVTVFRGLRVLLEQNAGGQPGSEEVRFVSASLEKYSCSGIKTNLQLTQF